VQQHLRRQDGVAKVDVSLVNGKVAIYPKSDSRFDPAGIFKAVYDSGVSIAEMTIIASGRLVRDPAKGMVFQISNTETFAVKPTQISETLKDALDSGKTLKLRGLLYRKPKGKVPRKPLVSMPLEILEVINR
jgi:hypothetical protein